MKLITFTVPCYNSAEYMRKCIDSILVGGDDVEILIVDDGSTDDTAVIADEYGEKYPDVIRVIHKQNGGHGSAINTGIENATGLYFKVVDSDDWVDEASLKKVIETVKNQVETGVECDLIITNFVYTRPSTDSEFVFNYERKIKLEQITDFSEMKKFHFSKMFLMHSLMYKHKLLVDCGIRLPEHTFYVDEIFAYKPLPYVKKLYYIDTDLYRYFIGRADQSVTQKNMFARYRQQMRVMREMIDAYSYDEIKAQSKGLRKYMFHALTVILLCTIYFIINGDKKERKPALEEVWQHIKERDIKLYRKLRHRSYATLINYMPWGLRKFIVDKSYSIVCRRLFLGVDDKDFLKQAKQKRKAQ